MIDTVKARPEVYIVRTDLTVPGEGWGQTTCVGAGLPDSTAPDSTGVDSNNWFDEVRIPGYNVLPDVQTDGGTAPSAPPPIILETDRSLHNCILAMPNEELPVEDVMRCQQSPNVPRRVRGSRTNLRKDPFASIIGNSPVMLAVYELMEKIIAHDRMGHSRPASVIISGETGTGKGEVAKALHDNGPRASKPFVTVNCAALTETLIESELFGHARGAFTSAVSDRDGYFRSANGGTIFLDEIGELSLPMQAKILHVVENGVVRPVGGASDTRVDVRIIAATHRQLAGSQRFREDLFYRLNGVTVPLPPLRERAGDVPQLVDCFCERMSTEGNLPRKAVSGQVMEALDMYRWPGNVRQLLNALRRAHILSGPEQVLRLRHFEQDIVGVATPETEEGAVAVQPLSDTWKTNTAEAVRNALMASSGNKAKAAKLLEISRSTLYRIMTQCGMSDSEETPQ